MRNADIREVDALAELWHTGWQEAHAPILPVELARHRTLESFRQRMRDRIADVRVAGGIGRPLGFAMFKHDELYQFYVAATARGTGLAAEMLRDAEQTLLDRGVQDAWLACAIGNDRAARFYAKQGWTLARTVTIEVEIPGGSFALQVWRYEKRLEQ
jgi:GNAT superfamily N-acetyltransferase